MIKRKKPARRARTGQKPEKGPIMTENNTIAMDAAETAPKGAPRTAAAKREVAKQEKKGFGCKTSFW